MRLKIARKADSQSGNVTNDLSLEMLDLRCEVICVIKTLQIEDLRLQLEDAEKRALENYELATVKEARHEQQVGYTTSPLVPLLPTPLPTGKKGFAMNSRSATPPLLLSPCRPHPPSHWEKRLCHEQQVSYTTSPLVPLPPPPPLPTGKKGFAMNSRWATSPPLFPPPPPRSCLIHPHPPSPATGKEALP